MRIPTGVWVAGITIALIAWSIHGREQERMARQAAPKREALACSTKSGWYFAVSEAALDKAEHFAHQGDKAAFDALIARHLLRPLKGGVRVHLEPGGGLTTSAIRLPGSTSVAWVPNEALSCTH